MMKNFWTNKSVTKIKTVMYDWKAALGDTIMEKYESLYIQVRAIHDDTAPSVAFVGTELGDVFECIHSGFVESRLVDTWVNPNPDAPVQHIGGISHLNLPFYAVNAMAGNEIVFVSPTKGICRLVVTNFLDRKV
jgi:hypothetical protein